MKTLLVRFTRPDTMTQAGGIVLRASTIGDGSLEYVVHSFNRERGSLVPTDYYWGSYSRNVEDALVAFYEKQDRAKRYDRGGSLIDDNLLLTELAAEIANAPQAA
jgi:hypothetical protein